MPNETLLKRCPWPADDPLMLAYHDEEWGVPLHTDQKIYEFLLLEVFQAGLSWRTVLHKRENFRNAFAGFHYNKVARFTKTDIERLMANEGIIRNRLKIESAISNAQLFLNIRAEFGSFDKYMWQWVGGKPLVNKNKSLKDVLAFTPEAEAWAKDMKKRGFKFLGPTVVYAHMQATGMVNDHMVSCFRHKELSR